MKKVFVNGNRSVVRVVSPFAYKDPIKTLDKSNEARVEVDGLRVFRSAVTSGRDVKNAGGVLKFHLYYYLTKEAAEARDTSRREFFPITSEEFRAYKDDPAYTIVLETAREEVAPETEVVVSEVAPVEPETEVLEGETPANEGTSRKSRRK
jgi:hypothetical protein